MESTLARLLPEPFLTPRSSKWLAALACILALTAGGAERLDAQFRALLPDTMPLKERNATISRNIYALEVRERDARAGVRLSTDRTTRTISEGRADSLRRVRNDVCGRHATTEAQEECKLAIGDSAADLNRNRRPSDATVRVLPLGYPTQHSTAAIARLTQSVGRFKAPFLGEVAASIGPDVKAIATDLVSGVSGRTLVDISTMLLTVDIKEGDSLRRDTLRPNKSRLTQALYNGGTVSAQFGWPLFATQGPTLRRAGHFAMHAGALGDITEPDSLQATGGATIELAIASSIFPHRDNKSEASDLVLAVRAGYVQTERSILADANVRRFGYLQLGMAVKRGEKFSLAVLISTTLSRALDAHVPRLQLILGT